MSTTTSDSRLSDGRADRPDRHLPCVSCGRTVRHPDPARAEHVRIYAEQPRGLAGQNVPMQYSDIPASRCDGCSQRRTFAMVLLEQHPRVKRAHGDVALVRLDAALAAVACVGRFGGLGGVVKLLTESDERLADLIRFLAELGASATWTAQRVTTPSARAWSHVGDELASEIRTELTKLVRRPFEPRWPFVPPGSPDGLTLPGCLFCGRGTITARESEGDVVWGPRRDVDAGVLGGNPRPSPVVGHLCGVCRGGVEREGAMGLPAVRRALLAHLGFDTIPGWSVEVKRLVAFAALPAGTSPNVEPWAHLDTAAIESALERTTGVKRVHGQART